MSELDPLQTRLLTPRQRKLVGFALSLAAFFATVALLVILVWVLGWLLSYFSGVLWPLATAGILALILRPVVDVMQFRLNARRLPAVILLFGIFVLAIGGLLVAVIPPLVGQLLDFIAFVPTFWARALAYIELHYPAWVELVERHLANPTIRGIVDTVVLEVQGWLKRTLPALLAAGTGALNVFSFVAHLATVPIYLFFFLLSRNDPTRSLGSQLTFLNENPRQDIVFLVREFIAIVVSFFRGQLLIGLLMGIMLAVGFSLVGLRFGLFIGVALGVLNIVPYLGTIIGLSVAIPLAFFQPEGGISLVALVLLVFVIVQNIEGWFLTPKIMGDRTGLHPVTIIVAIFFWGTALNGILGMILAIPLTAFFVTAWRLVKRKYFRPV